MILENTRDSLEEKSVSPPTVKPQSFSPITVIKKKKKNASLMFLEGELEPVVCS